MKADNVYVNSHVVIHRFIHSAMVLRQDSTGFDTMNRKHVGGVSFGMCNYRPNGNDQQFR